MNSESLRVVKPWKAILSYLIVALYLAFEMGVQVSPSVMTSQLEQTMSIGAFGIGLMSSVYFYSYTAMQIPAGLLFDRFNPRYVITLAIMLCSIGCLSFSLSSSLWAGAVSRLLTGFGSAFAFVAVLVVTADLFPHKYFAFITGITQALAALGAMSGQMPLSIAVSQFGWRQTMLMLAIAGLVLAVFVWCLLNYKRDLLNPKGTETSLSIKTALASITKKSQTWWVATYACLLWAPMSGFASLWGVPFLQATYQLSATQAAGVCSLMWLGLGIFSPIVGWASTALNTRKWPLAFCALLGFLSFTALINQIHVASWIISSLVFCAGAACAGQALSFTTVKENTPPNQRGAAIALNNVMVVVSGALIQPLIGYHLQYHCPTAKYPSITQCPAPYFQHCMWIVVFCYAIALVIAACFIRESANNPTL